MDLFVDELYKKYWGNFEFPAWVVKEEFERSWKDHVKADVIIQVELHAEEDRDMKHECNIGMDFHMDPLGGFVPYRTREHSERIPIDVCKEVINL